MTAPGLEISVRRQGPAAVLDLRGEIDAGAHEALQEAYADARADMPRLILLNFTEVEYINSTGIALIVNLLKQARDVGQRLAACGLNEHYQDIFEITRLTEYLPLFPDEPAALAGGR